MVGCEWIKTLICNSLVPIYISDALPPTVVVIEDPGM